MISAEERARLVYNGCDEMFSGKSWIEMPAKDFIDYTRQVQLDAFREAAEMCRKSASLNLGLYGNNKTLLDGQAAVIEARAKQLEQT